MVICNADMGVDEMGRRKGVKAEPANKGGEILDNRRYAFRIAEIIDITERFPDPLHRSAIRVEIAGDQRSQSRNPKISPIGGTAHAYAFGRRAVPF